jgi:hypothetical protein
MPPIGIGPEKWFLGSFRAARAVRSDQPALILVGLDDDRRPTHRTTVLGVDHGHVGPLAQGSERRRWRGATSHARSCRCGVFKASTSAPS